MARPQKWLTGVQAEMPVAEAAQVALALRLSAVRKLLKTAAQTACDPDENVEAVHQLRIGTRRAAAALRLFDEVLPRKEARWFRRRLRSMLSTPLSIIGISRWIKRFRRPYRIRRFCGI